MVWLQVGEEEVEAWAIKAMTAKLMDAKLDQLQRSLIVNHCAPRLWCKGEWGGMRGKLVGWRDRMKQLQAVVQATRQRQEQQLQMISNGMPPMH